MLHPHTQLRFVNDAIGFGVFATQFIPSGTLTWIGDELDQVVDPARVANIPAFFHEQIDKYAFLDHRGRRVLCWDLARFINHSCNPSCLGCDTSFEIAVRDIHPGEELTDDYASLHLQADETFRCWCGVTECRQWVSAADIPRCTPVWRNQIVEAMRRAEKLSQPLAPFLLDRLNRKEIGPNALKLLEPIAITQG